MKKIVITGPESTGKSYLARYLSVFFGQPHTEEEARNYLKNLTRAYQFKDLFKIAKKQMDSEDQVDPDSNQILFCDTDLITIKIWSQVRFNKVDKSLLKAIEYRHYDYYLLCNPDIPWEPDPMRENPHNRMELFYLYQSELEFYKKPYTVIQGAYHTLRIRLAIEAVEKIMGPDALSGEEDRLTNA